MMTTARLRYMVTSTLGIDAAKGGAGGIFGGVGEQCAFIEAFAHRPVEGVDLEFNHLVGNSESGGGRQIVAVCPASAPLAQNWV